MLSYFGGKSKIGRFIAEQVPLDITNFNSAFGGMFWEYFSLELDKYPNLETIRYNDYNPLNANIFRCVSNPDEFSKFLNGMECQIRDRSREGETSDPKFEKLFYQYQEEIFDNQKYGDSPNWDLGAKYAYVLSQVFSGAKPETAKFIDLKYKYRSKFDTFRDKVNGVDRGYKFKSMFQKISSVHNMDFAQFIEKFDSEEFFIYLDPPYYDREKMYSNHDFGKDDHLRLSDSLNKLKGRFILSYYHFPELEEWYPKSKFRWESKLFSKASGALKGKKQSLGEELLIMNY
jgi:DNA adenine methylase